MSTVAQKAWDATKGEDDVPYANITNGDFKAELEARVDGVRRTGLTINAFEEKAKELLDAEKSEAGDTPLGTKNALGQTATTAPAKEDESGESLHTQTRAELNTTAEGLGLNPDDYANKAEIIEAIEKARK